MRRSVQVTALAVVVLLLSVTPAAASSSGRVYGGDIPDPSVLQVGGSYWAYSTGSAGRNPQVMSSPDLRTWTFPVDPLRFSRPGPGPGSRGPPTSLSRWASS